MTTDTYLHLQSSESRVANVAATLFAAYIQRGEINDGNEAEYLKKAVATAIRLVAYTDRMVKSDEEWVKPEGAAGRVL